MSLIAHYRLDGDVNDAIGWNNGTASGALVFEDGKLGKCINLKTSGNVTFPTSIKHTYSVSFWYKRLSAPDGVHRKIFTKGGDRSPGFWTGTSDFLHLRQSLVNGGNIGADIYEIGTGVWRHIVFTCEQTAAGVRINSYMDGVKSASSGFYAGDSVNITGDPNSFMLNSDSVVGHSLDDIRIYDHALSEREVRDLAKGLALHYAFNQFQEPTENVFTNPIFAGTTGWSSTQGSITPIGDGVLSLRRSVSGTGDFQLSQMIPFSVGQVTTISFKCKKVEGTGAGTNSFDFGVGVWGMTPTWGMTRVGTEDIGNGWYKLTYVLPAASNSSGGATTGIHSMANNLVDTYHIKEIQYERKSYATPFVDGTRTGTVRDQSAQGNDAPLALTNTPKWIEGGMVGKGCYEFDGTAKYITLTGLKVVGDRTVAFWAYPREVTTDWRSIIDSESGRYIIGTLSGNFSLYLVDGWRLSVAATLNAWQHIAYVSEGTVTKVYKNGVYVTQFTGTIPQIGGTTKIGSRYPGETAYLNADLDDLRIYATALSSDEVKELYQQRASLDSRGNLVC